MKILVILLIITVSFIAGYQTKNDVLKDETLNKIRDDMKVTYIKLNDMSDVLDYLYDNTEILKNSDKQESQNKKVNRPVNTLAVKIQITHDEYTKQFEPMYRERVQKMLEDKLYDKIKVDCYFDPDFGLYNYYAFIDLNNFTSK